jgi:proline iminopeptidase
MRAVLLLLAAAVAAGAESLPRDGFDLHYQTMGKGSPIILLSGGPGFKVDYMMPVAEKLADAFTCVLLEQRGTGRSRPAKFDPASMTLRNVVEDLEALRVHLKLDTLTLVGHSWGGMLAMAYAAAHPDRVGRLLLIGPGGMDPQFQMYFGPNIDMRLWPPDKEARAAAKTPAQNVRAITPAYFFDREKALAFAKAMPEDALHGDVSPALWPDLAKNDNVRDAMKKLDRPTLIVQGRQDPIGESTAYEIHLAIQGSSLQLLNRCGHFPWIEQPEPFFKAAREFLSAR